MFDKIGRYAEALASSAGHSRRGFLELMGRSALSLSALAGAFLLFPAKAEAKVCSGACTYLCPNGSLHAKNCGSGCGCSSSIQYGGMTCPLYRSTCGYR